VISDVQANWDPLPVHISTITGSDTKKVGENLVYDVQFSNSYADDYNVVVYVPLPEAGRTCEDGKDTIENFDKYANAPYNQDLTPGFVDVYPTDNAGHCSTPGGCTIL